MRGRNPAVVLGRARLSQGLAGPLSSLPRGIRGRTIGFILMAHTTGLNLKQLVESATELRRLGVLINQSLRVSRGTSVDTETLHEAAELVKGMFP
jgi:hypothetical protein